MKSFQFLGQFAFTLAMATTLGLAESTLTSYSASAAETRTIQEVAVEVGGTKFWMPSTITVKKGDTVKIHAVSKVGGKNNIHGFAIDEFNVQALADDKGLVDDKGKHVDKDIEFIANKAGIFPIRCHLHAAHVGGQLVVLE